MLALWPLKYSPEQSTVIRLRLDPGQIKVGRPAETFTAADYCQHLMELKKKVPGSGFTIVIQPPFVVLGDDPPEAVRRSSSQTVKWAVDHLKASYFRKDPAEILDIWLFRDKESYEKNCKAIFKHAPTTPYGFFSGTDRALVMNIATGGGTLVHEIVHPFMAANFPGCPAWFNEGMGSLYEQSGEADGRIIGYTNWRLAGLQEAIAKKRVPAVQDPLRDHRPPVLRRRPRDQLRPGPIPLLLPPRARPLAGLLPAIHGEPRHRPHRLRHAPARPGPQRHGRLPEGMGGAGREAEVPVIADALFPLHQVPPRPFPRSRFVTTTSAFPTPTSAPFVPRPITSPHIILVLPFRGYMPPLQAEGDQCIL